MATTVSYPGVYIEEVPSGVRTITAVATSIAAFFGRASKGPINQAVRILSLADYQRQFGEPHEKSDLAYSVRQFFYNGGTDCYVVRLANNSDPAVVTLENLNGDEVLVATASADGEWGNTVRLEVDYDTPNPDESFNLTVIQEQEGEVVQTETFTGLNMNPNSARFAPAFVSESSELIVLETSSFLGDPDDSSADINNDASLSFDGFSNGRRPLEADTALRDFFSDTGGLFDQNQTTFQISVNDSAYVKVDLTENGISGTTTGGIAVEIDDMVNNALGQVGESARCTIAGHGFGDLLTITAGSTADSTDNVSVRVKRAASNDIAAALMLGVDQGGIEATRYANFRPAPTATLLPIGDPATNPAFTDAVDRVDDLAAIPQDSGSFISTIQIEEGGDTISLTSADFNIQTVAGGDWYQNAVGDSSATGDNDGVREKLKIIAQAISDNADVPYDGEVWGYNLALIATGGTINASPTLPTAGATTVSAFDDNLIVNVRQYSLGEAGTGDFSSGVAGTDGVAPVESTYQGSEADQTGFHALDAVDLFNLMVLPGDEEVDLSNLWGPANTYCAQHRAFLLIDPPSDWTDGSRPAVVQDTSMINTLRSQLGDQDHAAVFYPRLKFSQDGVTKTIGSAGAIAGLMARTDASRGVWKAPAGVDASIRNITGLTVELTDAENGVLNKKGVSCIRVFPTGIVSWGARTLDGDDDFGSEWKYIPVRRTALMLAESLYRGTRWAVFEPNDEPLWASIRLNLGAFMFSLFRQGAFQGTSPKEAYYVKCDSETTTQDDRNKGIVNIEVGFAPLKPAEFVVIKIQQMAGDL